MSDLPQIDPLKVAKREADKLRSQVAEASYRETQLEVLAEALRDERDEFESKLTEALDKITQLQTAAPVEDISTLPK